MNDLIKRQAVKDWLFRWEGYIDKDTITRMQCRVIDIPSAEVEPVKRGKWIYDNQFHWYRASCSECGYKRVTDIKAEKWNGWNYCPNCGAKMEPISASTENGQEVEE